MGKSHENIVPLKAIVMLQINGQHISWKILEDLYQSKRLGGFGLSTLNKITAEHVHLNSYSKMRVKLAVQV